MILSFIFLFAQAAASPDPVTMFAPLGVSGIICVVVVLWQRETKKDLDRANKHNEQLLPVLTRVLDVLEKSNSAHSASADAQLKGADALSRAPSEEMYTRLKVALEQVERSVLRNGKEQ